LAEYARAQHFSSADELLTEIIFTLLTPRPEHSPQDLFAAEERAIDAMRIMCNLTEPEE
jgi:hypothetical protein